MEKKTEKKEYTIDAAGQALGRVASQAAKILRGKNDPAFKPHLAPAITLKIINAGKIEATQKKLREKVYRHYTGNPGGLRQVSMARLIERKGWGEAVKKAVYGMLPDNRLRAVIMKNLIITE